MPPAKGSSIAPPAKPQPFRVAIVGCGPKGLYGLEHLLGELATSTLHRPVEIHLFNKSTHFGAGDIYRPEQPSILLMNFPNGYINMWRPGKSDALVDRPLSLTDWLTAQAEGPIDEEQVKNQYSTRATVGRYLHEGYKQLLHHCPKGINIIEYTGEVEDITPENDTYNISVQLPNGDRQSIEDIRYILLTTGHQSAVCKQQKNVIDFIYPVEKELSEVASGCKVAIKGMGLTFIDAVLAMTEGRGGHFAEKPEGSLQYYPSGAEPASIYPFSTSGLPMMPRKGCFQPRPVTPVFFNRDYLPHQPGESVDFGEELWPVIHAEMKRAYYNVAFKQYKWPVQGFAHHEDLEAEIEAFHRQHTEAERFDFTTLTNPIPGHKQQDCHHALTQYIRHTLHEAEKGVEESPLAAAADSWRHMSALFNEYYSFGGLTPASQQLFHARYAGHLNRITYGPPLVNMKKILALAEAHIIDFNHARNPVLQAVGDRFVLRSEGKPGCQADYLIDARIPRNNVAETTTPLYAGMMTRGMIQPYENSDKTDNYRPGCLDMTPQGHPIGRSGQVYDTITVSGTPAEGITYDNDTLSRKRNDFTEGWAKHVNKAYQRANTTVLNDN
ncbi:MAG: FAD/NAD(P)-binding protein [Cyclobacteriaceae bacterium]